MLEDDPTARASPSPRSAGNSGLPDMCEALHCGPMIEQQFSFWFLRIFLVSGLARFLAGRDWRMSGRNWRRLCEGEGLEQVLPRGKDQKCRDRREIVEELAARAELLPGRAPEFVADVADGVNGEGEKVQGHEDGGELPLSVTEAVFDVVSLGLENVEGFVLDLPARTTAGGKFGNIVGADRKVGDEAVAISDFALGVDDLDLEPVDEDGIIAAAERDVADPAVAEDGLFLAALDHLLVGRKVDPGGVFGDQRMRRWLADEDEMAAELAHGLAEGLAGEQVIAEIDRIEPGVARPVAGQPSLGGSVLAILLFRAVLRRDEFWFEWDNLIVPG